MSAKPYCAECEAIKYERDAVIEMNFNTTQELRKKLREALDLIHSEDGYIASQNMLTALCKELVDIFWLADVVPIRKLTKDERRKIARVLAQAEEALNGK
jgi:hypothetical protein